MDSSIRTNTFRRFRRSCIGLALSGFVLFTPTSAFADSDLNTAYRSPSELKQWLQAHPVANMHTDYNSDYSFTFEDTPSLEKGSYDEGSLSKADLNSALQLVNNIRYIAGLPGNVTLSNSYTKAAQAASLVSYANNSLSHNPRTPAAMSSKLARLGVKTCGESNIAWSSWKNCSLDWTILNSWMKDSSASNISTLGHRRWILSPEMKRTGFGAVSGDNGTYSTMYIFDFGRKVKKNYQVAWPAQNTPTSYFPDGTPWSLSLGKKLNAGKISVELTRLSDGHRWTFSKSSADGDFYVNNDGYGQYGCIIFNPNNLIGCRDGDSFRVDVSGVGKSTISYTVNFFDAGI